MKITNTNKGIIQFCFNNPHVFKTKSEIQGISELDINELKLKLTKKYGENWFSFFLALKPKALNASKGE